MDIKTTADGEGHEFEFTLAADENNPEGGACVTIGANIHESEV